MAEGIKLPSASATQDGLVTTGTQAIAGLKNFTVGQYISPASGADSNTTLVVGDVRHQFVTPTANRTYTLPTTSVLKGDIFTFTNNAAVSSSNLVILVNSSGGNLVRTVYAQTSARMMALQDTPTTAAHWACLDKAASDWISFTPSWTNPPTFGTNTGMWRRVGDTLEVQTFATMTAGGGGGTMHHVLPASLNMDTAKMAQSSASSSQYTPLGITMKYNGTITEIAFPAINNTTTQIANQIRGVNGGFVQGSDFGNGHSLGMNYKIPISGWTTTKG
jgi:hypothetical protein